MRRLISLGLLSALLACGGPRDFVGDNLGDDRVTGDQTEVLGTQTLNGGASDPSAYDLDGYVTQATCLRAADGQMLQLDPFEGGISVLHEGKLGSACGQWQVRAVINEADMQVDVHYDEIGGASCNRACAWRFDYDLDDLVPGEWTLNAGTESGTVVVP